MGDSSLDEFFAKKDRTKKNRSRTKFTTSDSIAKKMEEGGKRVEYPKKDLKEKTVLSANNPSSNSSNTNEQDDEWKNVEDEKERDYSGLRIQALSISEKEKEEEHLKEQMVDQNGEILKASDGHSGPWKIVAVPPPATPVNEEVIVEKPVETEVPVSNSTKPMAYKPPALRHSPASSSPSNSSSSSSKRLNKSAPQITSEIHFPTLSSAVDCKGKPGAYEVDRSFQSVKHGVKSKNESQHELQLDLENKFSALHGD